MCKIVLPFFISLNKLISHQNWFRDDFHLGSFITQKSQQKSVPDLNVLTVAFLALNISEEIRDLTAKDIGQKLGTLDRHMRHWADIKNIKQT